MNAKEALSLMQQKTDRADIIFKRSDGKAFPVAYMHWEDQGKILVVLMTSAEYVVPADDPSFMQLPTGVDWWSSNKYEQYIR